MGNSESYGISKNDFKCPGYIGFKIISIYIYLIVLNELLISISSSARVGAGQDSCFRVCLGLVEDRYFYNRNVIVNSRMKEILVSTINYLRSLSIKIRGK